MTASSSGDRSGRDGSLPHAPRRSLPTGERVLQRLLSPFPDSGAALFTTRPIIVSLKTALPIFGKRRFFVLANSEAAASPRMSESATPALLPQRSELFPALPYLHTADIMAS